MIPPEQNGSVSSCLLESCSTLHGYMGHINCAVFSACFPSPTWLVVLFILSLAVAAFRILLIALTGFFCFISHNLDCQFTISLLIFYFFLRNASSNCLYFRIHLPLSLFGLSSTFVFVSGCFDPLHVLFFLLILSGVEVLRARPHASKVPYCEATTQRAKRNYTKNSHYVRSDC